jgi:O-antigen/teichoic acid export membrane protein
LLDNTKVYYKRIALFVLQRSIMFAAYLIWTILFARWFGPIVNKNFNLLINVYGLLLLICGASMETGFTYLLQTEAIKQKTIIHTAAGISLLSGLVAALLAFIFASAIKTFFFVDIAPWQAFAYVSCWLFTGTCQYVFQIKNRLLLFNIIIATLIIMLLGVLYIMPTFSTIHNYAYLHFGFLILQFACLYIAFQIINTEEGKVYWLSLQQFKKVLRFSSWVLASNLVTFFIFKVDYFILEYFYHVKQQEISQDLLNSNYNIASRLIQIVLTVTVIIAQSIFPEIAKEQNRKLSFDRTNEIAKYAFIGFVLSCIGIAFTSKFIFPAIFGKDYNTMYKDFFYLIPGLIAQGVSGCYSAYLMGINKVKIVWEGCMIALIVIIIADIIFIPIYGTMAAALISSLGYTIQCFYSIFKIEKLQLNK